MRRSHDSIIYIMEIPIHGNIVFISRRAPRSQNDTRQDIESEYTVFRAGGYYLDCVDWLMYAAVVCCNVMFYEEIYFFPTFSRNSSPSVFDNQTLQLSVIRARSLSPARSKLRLCSANHRAGYFSDLDCDWWSIVWAYSEQGTENGPRSFAAGRVTTTQ